jgi:hypothetical protein
MQRKLIGYDVFEKLTEGSLPAAQYELVEAEEILSRLLETGPLSFHNFNETHVLYETEDGTFVRANYSLGKQEILFESIEEIVIDEATEAIARKDVIRNMIDAVLEDNKPKANHLFDEVMGMVRTNLQRESAKERNTRVNEATGAFSRRRPRRGKKSGAGVFVRYGPADPGRSRRAKEGHRKHPRAAFRSWETRKRHDPRGERQKRDRKLYGRFRRLAASVIGRRHKKTMTEWVSLTENVFNYIDYVENGRVMNEAAVKTTPQGDITAIKIPNSKLRNEGKILSFQLKTMKTDLKVLRETARRLSADRDFVGMVAELKRHNNLSDNTSLEECLGDIVSKFPAVLYLTQDELAHVIGEALSRAGVSNYGDDTCSFMSEGILRVAHGAFNDRVARINQLSGHKAAETEDPYIEFQNTVAKFYPSLDESVALEMKVFEDLYNAALEVRRMALESKNEELRNEAEELATNLQTVLEGEAVPSLELAATVAGWLENIVETNLESDDWDVVKTPHTTVTGDHPRMAQNAKHPYTPASDFSGDWGSELPQLDQDGKGYKTFGNKSKNTSYVGLMDDGKGKWGDQYPDLQNPHVPKAITPTLKGEPGVDKNYETGLDMWQSGDTWPSLQNPYVPKSVKPHINSDNRVDDKENRWTDVETGTGSLEPKVTLGGKKIDGR